MFALGKPSGKTLALIGGTIAALVGVAAASWDVLSPKRPRENPRAISPQTTAPQVLDAFDSDETQRPKLAQPELAPVENVDDANHVDPESDVDKPMTEEEAYVVLNNSFEMDAANPASARTMEHSIEGVFRSLQTPGARLQNVECRTKSCRAVIEFADVDSDRGTFEEILDDTDNPLGNFGFTIPRRDKQEDGRIVATLFLAL